MHLLLELFVLTINNLDFDFQLICFQVLLLQQLLELLVFGLCCLEFLLVLGAKVILHPFYPKVCVHKALLGLLELKLKVIDLGQLVSIFGSHILRFFQLNAHLLDLVFKLHVLFVQEVNLLVQALRLLNLLLHHIILGQLISVDGSNVYFGVESGDLLVSVSDLEFEVFGLFFEQLIRFL